MEAALLGRPTLAILPRFAEKEWLDTIRSGITPCVTTREQLRVWLKEWALSDRPIPIPESNPELFGALQRALAAIEQVLRGLPESSPPAQERDPSSIDRATLSHPRERELVR
jgi:hypothetical protein